MSRNTRPVWALLFILLLESCGLAPEASRLGIVGGDAWNKTPTPVVAVTLVSKNPTGMLFTRSCTATRISDKDFVTAASCFDTYIPNNGKLGIVTASTGEKIQGLTIKNVRTHPNYDASSGGISGNNIAVFTLESSSPDLDKHVLKADIDPARPQALDPIEVFGAGCTAVNESDSCASVSSWAKGTIKSFTSKVELRDDLPTNLSGQIFFSNRTDGLIAGEDLGGPVFKYDAAHSSWKLIAINNFTRVVFKKEAAYLWLGHADNDSLLRPNGDQAPTDRNLDKSIELLIHEIDAELAKCGASGIGNASAVSSVRRLPGQVTSKAAAVAKPNSPCPTDTVKREARVKALMIAKGYALAAKQALADGNLEDALELYNRAKENLELALSIVEFIVDFTPAGRAKDGYECLSGYKVFPVLEVGEGGRKEFKIGESKELERFFACLSAAGLDERFTKYVGGYLIKFDFVKKVVGHAETFLQTVLKPAEVVGKKIVAKFDLYKLKKYENRLSETLAKVEKALGEGASKTDVEEYMDVAAKLNLKDPDHIENLAGILGSSAEVNKLNAIIGTLDEDEVLLLGVLKGQAPHIDTDEAIDVMRSLKDWNVCRTLGASLQPRTFKGFLSSFFAYSMAAKISNDCFRDSFEALAKQVNLHPQWKLKGAVHVLYGDFVIKNGIVKVAGGLHTDDALLRLVALNKTNGVNLDIVDVDRLSELNNTFDIAAKTGKIFRKTMPNGVVVIQIPDQLMEQEVSAVIDGVTVQGIKTLFPPKMSQKDIFKASADVSIPENTFIKSIGPTRSFQGTVESAGYKIKVFFGVDNKSKDAFSLYPVLD